MENWGLVTYQEGGLLYEEEVSSLLHKEAIATVIAHELAHQVGGENCFAFPCNKTKNDVRSNFMDQEQREFLTGCKNKLA